MQSDRRNATTLSSFHPDDPFTRRYSSPLVFYYRQCYDCVINLEETHDDRTTDLMSRKREQMFFDTGMDRSGTRAKCKSMLGVWPSSQNA